MTTSINRIGLAKATLGMVLAVALNAASHAQTAQSNLSPDETYAIAREASFCGQLALLPLQLFPAMVK